MLLLKSIDMVEDLQGAMIISLTVALVMLCVLGALVEKLSREDPLTFRIHYVLLGLMGAALSFVVGNTLKGFLTLGRWMSPW